jgi:mono/diheme cytochrome c family protein/plastocyanin
MVDPVQAAIGIIVALITVGALLYVFYSRTNAVEKTGFGALIMLAIVSLMIPVFWITESNAQAISKVQQHTTAVERGAALYAQYCFQCHGLNGQGLTGPKLNGSSTVNKLSDDDIIRIISGGIPVAADPTTFLMPAWSEQFGGPLTQLDIEYLFALIRSSDPTYLSANVYPSGPGSNGFDQVSSIIQASNPTAYQTAVAQATAGASAQFTTVDLSNEKSITIDIIDSPAGASCQPSCYAIADPKNPGQMIINPNVKTKVGTTITWVNKSAVPHTVTSMIGEVPTQQSPATVFNSGNMNSGQSFTYTVKLDAYNVNKDHGLLYYCQYHSSMVAELTIVP